MKKTDIIILTVGGILISVGVLFAVFGKNDETIVIYNSSKAEIQTTASTICTVTTHCEPITNIITEIVTEPEKPLYININTADCEEFMRLEGIGEARAEAIIEYRELHGGYKNIEEIMLVDGIGQGIFDEIRPYIYVENPVYEITTEPCTAEQSTEAEKIVTTTENLTENITEITTLASGEKLDINTATFEELMQIPCMTKEYAELIIAEREVLGGFSNVYELLYIDEIPQKMVAEYIKFLEIVQ